MPGYRRLRLEAEKEQILTPVEEDEGAKTA
jgi:hypothetical protein